MDDSAEADQRFADQRFAEDYYELRSVDLGAVGEIYALRPLTQPLVTALNDQLSLADLAHDIAEIGYPAVQIDDPSDVSRPDRSGADQIDVEHQPTDLAVLGVRIASGTRSAPDNKGIGGGCAS